MLPQVDLPAGYRHAAEAGWQPVSAVASSPSAEDTDWWSPNGDAPLAELLQAVAAPNPTLAQAEARHRQARALVDSARASALPQQGGDMGGTRSGGRGSAKSSSSTSVTTGTLYRAGLNLSWTPDLWGRVARQQEAALAEAEGSADRVRHSARAAGPAPGLAALLARQ